MRCTPSHLALPFLAVGAILLLAPAVHLPESAGYSAVYAQPAANRNRPARYWHNRHYPGTARIDQHFKVNSASIAGDYYQQSPEMNRFLAGIFDLFDRLSFLKSLRQPFTNMLSPDSTLWGQYKWRIITAGSIVIFQTILIVGLLLERNRKRAAARSLAESEERYRNVIETQTELICRYLPDTTLTFVNEAYCRYFAKARDELIGSKFIDLVPPNARDTSKKQIQQLIEKPTTEALEHEVIRPDGTIGWQQWTDQVISNHGQIEFQGIGRDITERKRAEIALALSEEFNRNIVESSTDCIKILDLEGNLIYMNETGQRLLELDDFERYRNRSWVDLWDGEDRQLAEKAIAQARDQGIGTFQGFLPTLKNKPKWWHTIITPLRDTSGTVEQLLALSRDITEQKLSLKAIQESEARFTKLFNANPYPMGLTAMADGRFLNVNRSFLEMSGYTRDEVIGRTSIELNMFETPEHRKTLLVKPLTEVGVVRNLEMKFRTKSGAFRVLLASAELLELGGEMCVLMAASDISERKALEEELRSSEREFSTLVENSPDLITRLDRNLRHIYVSPSLVRVIGIPSELIFGKNPIEIPMDFDLKSFQSCCAEAFATAKPTQREFEYKDRNYWIRFIPELSAEGEVESVMTIGEDVTDRLRSEQELLQLTVRLFNLQDEERRRIARELHDGTAQNLFAISVNLAKLAHLSATNTDEVRKLVEECQLLGEESVKEIRTLSYLLHPPLLDQAGLVSAVKWYVEGFTKRSGISVEVFAQPIGRLPSEVEMALFRVVQEALTNVRRHSSSETASLRIERKQDSVILEIKDQGKGLMLEKQPDDASAQISMGVGIPGMRQRIRQLGGKLEILSHEQGTTIAVVVPITNGAGNGTNPSRGRS